MYNDVILKLRRLASACELRFDPNQPRIPAGQPDGGQWTTGSVHDGGDTVDIRPEDIIASTKEIILAAGKLSYQRCLDLCYPLLERLISPRWSDINSTDFTKCMNACLAR
jgi:hypothetical protein